MIDLESFSAGDFEFAGIETELVKDCGVDVGDVVPVFDGVEADFVGRAMHEAALDAAACHPNRETVDVMVATIRTL